MTRGSDIVGQEDMYCGMQCGTICMALLRKKISTKLTESLVSKENCQIRVGERYFTGNLKAGV